MSGSACPSRRFLALLVFLGGCVQAGEPEERQEMIRRGVLGRSVEGRPIPWMELGKGKDVVLILASIHGSEGAGTPLARRLAIHLLHHPRLLDGRKVIIVPEVNPDGLTRKQRTNARGVDLNRNFPAENRVNSKRYGQAALSEPEALVIARLLERRRPARIVTLHEPLNCVDYDGPGKDLAKRMAESCRLPVRRLGGKPGSLGSYAGGTLGIPIITLELPKTARDMEEDALWERFGGALVAAILYPRREMRSLNSSRR